MATESHVWTLLKPLHSQIGCGLLHEEIFASSGALCSWNFEELDDTLNISEQEHGAELISVYSSPVAISIRASYKNKQMPDTLEQISRSSEGLKRM